MYAGLTQACDIYRLSQEVVEGRKTEEEEPLVTDVECSIQPISDTKLIAALGSTTTDLWMGAFPPDIKLRHGDTVVLRTEAENLTFRVDTEMTFNGPGLDHPYVVETVLARTKIR